MNWCGYETTPVDKGCVGYVVDGYDRRVSEETSEVNFVSWAFSWDWNDAGGGGLVVHDADGGFVGYHAGDGFCAGFSGECNHVETY